MIVASAMVASLVLPEANASTASYAFLVNVFAAVRQNYLWRIPITILLTVVGHLVLVEPAGTESRRLSAAAVLLFLLALSWVAGELWSWGSALIRLERERAQYQRAELRLSLARDLHDTVAQTLSRAAMRATVLLVEEDLPTQVRDELGVIAHECRSSAHDLRRMLSSLRDGEEGGTGLVPAAMGITDFHQFVVDQVERLRQAGFVVNSQIGVDQLSAAQLQTMAAVVVEATNNMVKHASPEIPCEIRIELLAEDLVAVFRNGLRRPGRFQPGLGLTGIRERLALLGGSYGVVQDGRIWTLTARLPQVRPELR